MLQWGRDVSIPEIFHTALEARLDGLASMGPGCFYPGNKLDCPSPASGMALQWGRDVSIPEIPSHQDQ